MQIESDGILINMYPFSERDMIARVFTKDNGVLVGMLRGAGVAKKNKALIGQYGSVAWNARLDSQLGVFHWEPEKNLAAQLMLNPDLLKIMNSVFALICVLIPERESYENLYRRTLNLLADLPNAELPYENYLQWELGLLADLGYALDLNKCSGCGVQDNLCYVSPKTGRAVCKNCGQPYADKLYKMPLSLDVLKRFVENVCRVQGVEIPFQRKML